MVVAGPICRYAKDLLPLFKVSLFLNVYFYPTFDLIEREKILCLIVNVFR